MKQHKTVPWRHRKKSEGNRISVLKCGCKLDVYENEIVRFCDEHKKIIKTRWVFQNEGFYECSYCDYSFFIEAGTLQENEINYCPKCGSLIDAIIETQDYEVEV